MTRCKAPRSHYSKHDPASLLHTQCVAAHALQFGAAVPPSAVLQRTMSVLPTRGAVQRAHQLAAHLCHLYSAMRPIAPGPCRTHPFARHALSDTPRERPPAAARRRSCTLQPVTPHAEEANPPKGVDVHARRVRVPSAHVLSPPLSHSNEKSLARKPRQASRTSLKGKLPCLGSLMLPPFCILELSLRPGAPWHAPCNVNGQMPPRPTFPHVRRRSCEIPTPSAPRGPASQIWLDIGAPLFSEPYMSAYDARPGDTVMVCNLFGLETSWEAIGGLRHHTNQMPVTARRNTTPPAAAAMMGIMSAELPP